MVFRLRKMYCKWENWTEQIAMESRKLCHKFKAFQRATRKQKTSPGYTNKKRTSKVYHFQFPRILKDLEVNTVQFLGGDCI